MTFASCCNAMQMWYTVMNHETGTSPSEPDIASIPGLRAQATASLSAVAPRLLWLAPNASMHEPSSSAAGEMKPPDLNLTETVLNSGIMHEGSTCSAQAGHKLRQSAHRFQTHPLLEHSTTVCGSA